MSELEQATSSTAIAVAPVYADAALTVPAQWLQLPESERYEKWHSLITTLGRLQRSSSWWIGDALLWGEENVSEKYSQAVEDTGMARQTIINIVHVCSRIPPARRRAELPFGHHEAVTMLEPAQQDAWLQAAIDHGWSRSDLRERIAEWKQRYGHGQPPSRPQPTPGHDEAAAAVDAAREAARPPVPPPACDGTVLAAAAADTLRDVAAQVYDSAVELEAAFADQPNMAYMAVPAHLLQRLHEILGIA